MHTDYHNFVPFGERFIGIMNKRIFDIADAGRSKAEIPYRGDPGSWIPDTKLFLL